MSEEKAQMVKAVCAFFMCPWLTGFGEGSLIKTVSDNINGFYWK